LIAWRKYVVESTGIRVTFTDLLIKVVATAIHKHPRVNAFWQDGSILLSKAINIGLAVAVEDGLVVPVVHNADQLSVSQIADRRQELVNRGQEKRLLLEDLQDGTFTISNLGMYGVDIFNAIINPPQAAILAVGRIHDRVVALDGQPVVQPMMYLSLAYDHRVVDGARGAQLLETIAGFIEEPFRLVD
ncbi:2-oxo acid dehydrogenase subunit E2, partial [Chloroflexota bacterium]